MGVINKISFIIVDDNAPEGEQNVTDNYNVTAVWGVLVVGVRSVSIGTNSNVWPYDGLSHSDSGYYIVKGSFVDIHSVEVVTPTPSITEIGSVENVFSLIIYDENGEEVPAGNYELIISDVGVLEVRTRNIGVISANDTKEYDGTPLTNGNMLEYTEGDLDGLLPGHYVVADVYGSITEVGSILNRYDEESVRILDEYGRDVSYLYSVAQYEYGTLTVTKARETILVFPVSKHEEFAGQTLSTLDKDMGVDLEKTPRLRELVSLGYSYTFKLENKSISSPGSIRFEFEEFAIFDPSGEDVTDEFNFMLYSGDLELTIGYVQIYLYEKHYEYSGKALTYTPDEYAVVSIGKGVTFVMKSINVNLTEVGELSSSSINALIDIFLDYEIYVEGSDVDWSDAFVVEVVNYPDGGEYCPIKVLPREIVITTGSASKPYDGSALTNNTYVISKGSLAEGHTIVIKILGSVTNREDSEEGNNNYQRSSFKILDEQGNDVKHNYNYTIVQGTLTVY